MKFVNVGAYRTSKPIWHLFWFDQVIASTFSLIPVSISKLWALFIFKIVAAPFNIVAAPAQFLALLKGIIFIAWSSFAVWSSLSPKNATSFECRPSSPRPPSQSGGSGGHSITRCLHLQIQCQHIPYDIDISHISVDNA